MEFESPLTRVTLLKRYKRFLADVELPNGHITTVHTANTGSMAGCAEPGSKIWIRHSGNPKRKYPYSWEISETAEGVLVGINTGMANKLVHEAIELDLIDELHGYNTVQTEVRYGSENSRIDLLLSDGSKPDCYVEVKNVTASYEPGVAAFPDAVTARGAKHLRELLGMVRQGYRGVMCFCVQRMDVDAVRPADEVDPMYGETLRTVAKLGVEVIAYQTDINSTSISIARPLKVLL